MIQLPPLTDVESRKATNWPIRLFAIATGGPTPLYYTDSDAAVNYNSIVWEPKGIAYSRVQTQLGMKVGIYTVSIDNIDSALISWALAHDPTGYIATCYKGYTDGTKTNGALNLIEGYATVMFSGTITGVKADLEFAISVKSNLDLMQQRAPKSTQDVTCRFKGKNGFKGPNCGYSGPATVCNYSFATCTGLGNQVRFGGFPFLNDNTKS